MISRSTVCSQQHFNEEKSGYSFSTNLIVQKRGAKDTRGIVTPIDENKLVTPWQKNKKTNRQMIVHKTQHRKRKTSNTNPTKRG